MLSNLNCSNDGGGGERVLWRLVESLKKKRKDIDVVIYTGDEVAPTTILKTAKVVLCAFMPHVNRSGLVLLFQTTPDLFFSKAG